MAEERSLPAGLGVCPDCGAVRGETREGLPDDWLPADEGETMVSTCYCEGQVCARCGRRRRRRPISDYYDAESGEWFHVPHFMGLSRVCSDCRKAEDAGGSESRRPDTRHQQR